MWPPLAIAFVLVVRSKWRIGLAVAASAGLTYWSYRHLGPWEWWVPIVILLALAVAAATPARTADGRAVRSREPRDRETSRSALKALA